MPEVRLIDNPVKNVFAMKVFSCLCIISGIAATTSQIAGSICSRYVIGMFGGLVYVAAGSAGLFSASSKRKRRMLLATGILSMVTVILCVADPIISDQRVKSSWIVNDCEYSTTVVYAVAVCSVLALIGALGLIYLTHETLPRINVASRILSRIPFCVDSSSNLERSSGSPDVRRNSTDLSRNISLLQPRIN